MLDQLYVYLGILGWMFITGMGILPLVPEEVAVSTVGVMAAQKELNLLIAWACCIVGIIGTDMVLYGIGRTGGKWLLSRAWVKRLIPDDRREKIIDGFHSHGIKFLVSGRLLPGIRSAIFIVAGAIHYPFPRFLLADLVSIPVISFFFFGSVYAAKWIEQLINNLHEAQNLVLLVLLAALAALGAYKYAMFIRRRAMENNFEPPHIPVIEQLLPHEKHEGGSHPAKTTDPGADRTPSPTGESSKVTT
jgi:membrane protein DedA with SNARE-associated domain